MAITFAVLIRLEVDKRKRRGKRMRLTGNLAPARITSGCFTSRTVKRTMSDAAGRISDRGFLRDNRPACLS
jgi:hypothetical protein